MVQNPAIGPEMASTGAFDLSALQLYADDTERLLICCHSECGFALSVSRSQATSHLRDKVSDTGAKMSTNKRSCVIMPVQLRMSLESCSFSYASRSAPKSSLIASLALVCWFISVAFSASHQTLGVSYRRKHTPRISPPSFTSSGCYFLNTLYRSDPILILAFPGVRGSSSIRISTSYSRGI